jgi:hypothetical protein
MRENFNERCFSKNMAQSLSHGTLIPERLFCYRIEESNGNTAEYGLKNDRSI